jgi:hypothetical protein
MAMHKEGLMIKTFLAYVGGVSLGVFTGMMGVLMVLKYEKNIKNGIRKNAMRLQKFAEASR